MYRILIVKSERDDYQSLYQWLTSTDADTGDITPVEFETIEELDVQVEEMLNSGYAKADFVPVKYIDYTIEATDYDE